MNTPPIQWYPGHIAKAEKQLKEQLKLVDVVLEVRDARIPISTEHPQLKDWLGTTKKRVLILNRVDMIPPEIKILWSEYFIEKDQMIYFANAQQGQGIISIQKAAQKAGIDVNKKRESRGMLPRPVRAVVIGFPNVGKSALINRLLGKRVVESARKPGVTRQLRWVRISEEIELLDSPGIIPWKLDDQIAALKLAICEDIGDASYDNQRVAALFIDLLKAQDVLLSKLNLRFSNVHLLRSRYEVSAQDCTGEDYLVSVANHKYKGDIERTSRQILHDFRKGNLGNLSLELPVRIDN